MPLTITPSNVILVSGSYDSKPVASGVSITAGDILTLNASGGTEWYLADAAVANRDGTYNLWVALNDGEVGQIVPAARAGSVISLGLTGLDGDPFYLGSNGEIAYPSEVTTADKLTFLGYGNASSYFVFQPTVTTVAAGSVIA